ncbi:MAG: alpha/beta fold hydrolase [Sphingopyxis sp.]
MIRPTPRPFPLFLDLVRQTAEKDPQLARRALSGVRIYGDAVRLSRPMRTTVARLGRVSLLDGGGTSGPPVVLVPSLINPSSVLDLAPGNSLTEHLSESGFRPFLLDWGCPTPADRHEGIADHVTDYLVPLVAQLSTQFNEPVHLVGYCLGGTMALAAAAQGRARALTLLATPWHFDRYGEDARIAMRDHWARHRSAVDAMGMMPIEVLQSLFWALAPERTVSKYAALADAAPDDAQAMAFATLEDWANSGAPITASAARELFDDLIGTNASGTGNWQVGGQAITPKSLSIPCMHFTAHEDRIAPAATAPDGIARTPCPSGHVGMVVGRGARAGCWEPLTRWLHKN